MIEKHGRAVAVVIAAEKSAEHVERSRKPLRSKPVRETSRAKI
jgi:hypothetical protein